MGEIADNCPGVRLVLVALKCDLRERSAEDDEDETAAGADPARSNDPKRPLIDYKQGLAVAEKIRALRYLGKSISYSWYTFSDAKPRVLGDEEQRRQRSVYGSRPRRPTG